MRGIHATVGALPLLGVPSAFADETPLEDLLVTGSRISRSDFESPSPIVTVDRAAFQQTATFSVERVLNAYPQFVPTAGGTTNEPSNDGQANVSLRGLGADRTLVLVDGRRLMPADGHGVVDLNILPSSLIRNVQVLTGGASAAYGSDAIAGVVNFEMADDFSGIGLQASAATTSRGDGEEYSLGLTSGTQFAGGCGSVVAAFEYTEREAVMQPDRSFSKHGLTYYADETEGVGPGSAFVPSGNGIDGDGLHIVFADVATFQQVFAGYGYGPGSVGWQAGFGVNADGTVFTVGTGVPGTVVNYRGPTDSVLFNDRVYETYDAAPFTALQMPLERASAWVRGTFDATDDLELYGQLLYADYSVERRLAPAAMGIALIPAAHPDVPGDLATLLAARETPDAPYRYWRRASEVGPQFARNDRTVLQVTTGLRGTLGSRWDFDVYAQFGENERLEHQTNNVSLTRLQDLAFAPDAGRSICAGGFNPYVAGSLSPECARYIATDASSEITVRQTLAEASITGPIGSLPTGEVRAAAGLFYKLDEFEYDADPTLSRMLPAVPGVIGPRPDVAGLGSAPDRGGDESNLDAYAELRVPLLRGERSEPALELGLGYRRSDYSQAGAVDSYKGELMWRASQSVRLRGSYQHAVRAPSIEELYYPLIPDQFIVPRPDPCSASSAARTGPDAQQVEALCLAQGLPPELLPHFHFDLRRTDGMSGGNPALDPEQADTVTVGIVFSTPDFGSLEGPQVAIDWYRIELEDGIGRWDSESAVERCFDPAYNPKYEVSNVYCQFFSRNSDDGVIFAEIVDRNIGALDTTGVDLQVDWGLAAGPDHLDLKLFGTYIENWTYHDPGGGGIEYAGTVGGAALGRSLPRWKSLATVSYTLGGASFMVRLQHLDGMRDVTERNFEVPETDYVDVGASYAFTEGALRGLALRAGVDNLTDEQPPVFPTWQQANTDPSQFDVLGRRYYLRIEYALH